MLNYIAINPNSSTNDCYMYLNDTPYAPISYEDVNLRIQNLIDLGLIQNVKNLDNKNNKKSIENYGSLSKEKSKQDKYLRYYSVSSAGIFYLFSTDPEITDFEIILKNKEDGLFVNFLYSNLDFSTLEKIENIRTIIHITSFLGKCCKTIQQVLKTIRRIDEKEGESDYIGFVQGLADPEYDDGLHGPRAFILGLKNILKIEWLDLDETKIIEVEKNKLFKIHDEKENELFLEICPENNVAVLSDNKNHKIREFYLEKDLRSITGEDYPITYFNAITVEDYIDKIFANKDNFHFYPEMDEYESELCEELLVHMRTTYPIMNEEHRMIQRQDCIAIAKDKNFQELESHFKRKIDSCHENFVRLSHIKQV
ncbi:MAG TPA: hypothetical protein VLA74_04280 [Nitrososphaeraceae archaeon]|nr:hypothetical protein [Nitrososphaeraceae archaeon]